MEKKSGEIKREKNERKKQGRRKKKGERGWWELKESWFLALREKSR